jgi:NTP pyrophosphatase (non-canonical NTP hydrolase)
MTFDLIRQWAHDRNLIEGTDAKTQCLKTMEELGELARAINKNRIDDIRDGIGDVIVTLVIIAEQYEGLSVESAIEAAYDEIKDRKGIVKNGVFIKEGD